MPRSPHVTTEADRKEPLQSVFPQGKSRWAGILITAAVAAGLIGLVTTLRPNPRTGPAITLTHNTAVAPLSATRLVPGQTGSNCITITYAGTTPAAIKLYTSAAFSDPAGAADYLKLTIQQGTMRNIRSWLPAPGPRPSDPCEGFTPVTTIYTGTLDDFATTHTTFTTGTGTWTPSTTASQAYKITITLQPDTPNALQSAEITPAPTLQWEAQTPPDATRIH